MTEPYVEEKKYSPEELKEHVKTWKKCEVISNNCWHNAGKPLTEWEEWQRYNEETGDIDIFNKVITSLDPLTIQGPRIMTLEEAEECYKFLGKYWETRLDIK
jgi:hypothetical protein